LSRQDIRSAVQPGRDQHADWNLPLERPDRASTNPYALSEPIGNLLRIAAYVVKQLNYIQSLVRAAPVMHGIVKDLTPAEIQAVAFYVQSK
jgi:hypothetical protein